MFLIVGLGNPGSEYEETRHNVGFMVLDRLAAELGIKVDRIKFKGLFGEGVYEGEKLLLLKPMTYMNLSGQSVIEAMKFYKIPPENLVVIYDDMDLPVGRLRIRGSGSSGGHKGMESIIYLIASDGFPRIRIGIGRPPGDVVDHVLGRFEPGERKKIETVIGAAVEAALTIVRHGVQEAMNRYNGFEA
ncbi:aminoacyl-tRNA hydrolase [Thermosediminibacter litoriperuensis]|uniref:Peptidyl-tRNA hydrolase n=1 Tax=Thermosediminibacter litoriperuensis TaxID=291989 RepID=A0A5S5ALE1_9FIRM|nr:aminoacyl-tRNA hydrolase [Thermosediminibacter litoriperuensis]TYP51664.1 PTH1 family peptidyl-tRNA hydrolase [Thermosediminibacter litoriperuensis]